MYLFALNVVNCNFQATTIPIQPTALTLRAALERIQLEVLPLALLFPQGTTQHLGAS